MTCGSLVLRCTDCSSDILIQYGQGVVPHRRRLPDLTSRSNDAALTNCPRCLGQRNRGLEGPAHPTRDLYRPAPTSTICPAVWNASNFVKAAALVLGEPTALLVAGRVCLHIDWDLVRRKLGARDKAMSLGVLQVDGGDPRRVVSSHLSGNWL